MASEPNSEPEQTKQQARIMQILVEAVGFERLCEQELGTKLFELIAITSGLMAQDPEFMPTPSEVTREAISRIMLSDKFLASLYLAWCLKTNRLPRKSTHDFFFLGLYMPILDCLLDKTRT